MASKPPSSGKTAVFIWFLMAVEMAVPLYSSMVTVARPRFRALSGLMSAPQTFSPALKSILVRPPSPQPRCNTFMPGWRSSTLSLMIVDRRRGNEHAGGSMAPEPNRKLKKSSPLKGIPASSAISYSSSESLSYAAACARAVRSSSVTASHPNGVTLVSRISNLSRSSPSVSTVNDGTVPTNGRAFSAFTSLPPPDIRHEAVPAALPHSTSSVESPTINSLDAGMPHFCAKCNRHLLSGFT
mmetsp:Transcript_1155/g.3584  ORF Transcript_1155/g.3584 Transcript_1155/m.3584 type:complete len:241 (-) Transcript_1155:1787-2509(-)